MNATHQVISPARLMIGTATGHRIMLLGSGTQIELHPSPKGGHLRKWIWHEGDRRQIATVSADKTALHLREISRADV